MNDNVYSEAHKRVLHAYDPAQFDIAGQTVIREITEFLQRSQKSEGSVLNWEEPLVNIRSATELLDDNADIQTLVKAIFSHGQTMHDPRYIGHQVPPPIPVAALFEAVSSISNQGMTIYEMGPWSSAVERVMLNKLGLQLGLKEGFGGVLTSGGSLANLTALLTARNVAFKDVWTKGLGASHAGGVILSHGESHYCIERAAGILGIGTENCLKVALDDNSKMDAAKLEQQLRRLRSEGRTVIAVVASACSTRTGVYDPIEQIAAVCKEFGVWLHVDAAHGGAAAFSTQYAHYLKGIEQADSIVWDAHKMMFMPALSTYLFYRRSDDQYQAVSQSASYLFDSNAEKSEAFNTGLGTIECTKRAAAFSLWGSWAIFGKQLFTDLIDTTYGMTQKFAALMAQHAEFSLLNQPESNIIVFRYVPAQLRDAPLRQLGDFQKELRKRLIESGESYIVSAVDNEVSALRMVVMNPLTTEAHFESLIASLRRHSTEILSQ